MSRKILKVWLTIVGLIVAVFAGAPAHATGTAALPNNFEIIQLKALQNENALMVGFLYHDSAKDLVGYEINADGTLSAQIVFETSARMASDSVEVAPITLFRDGTLGLAWAATNTYLHASTLNVAFSADGIIWTPTSHPSPTLVTNQGPRCGSSGYDYCRYIEPRIAMDGKGKIAIAYSMKGTNWEVQTQVTSNKTTWTPVIRKIPNASRTNHIEFMLGLTGGGFEVGGTSCSSSICSYWLSVANTAGTKYSATTTWDAKNTSPNISTVMEPIVVSSSVAILPLKTSSNSQMSATFSWVEINPANGKWAAMKSLQIQSLSLYQSNPVSIVDLEGRLTIAFKAQLLDANHTATGVDDYYKIVFQPGSTTPTATLVGTRTEAAGEIINFNTIYLDSTAQLHLIFVRKQAAEALDAVFTQAGLTNPQTITGLSSQVFSTVTTPKGNQVAAVTVLSYNFISTGYVQTSTQSDAPRLAGKILVTGKAKKGSRLNVSPVNFVANNAVDSTTYEWYTCRTAVAYQMFGAAPVGCTLSSATSSASYTLKSSDKGKYVGVLVTAHSGATTTAVFSKTTAKIG